MPAYTHDIEEVPMAPLPDRPAHDSLLTVWFVLGLIFTLFVAIGAGILGSLSGQSAAAAVLTGVSTFAAIFVLVLMTMEVFKR
ncbi:hypothetical protein QF034_003283 [Streptomyces africanus]|uniref:Uncharacterized protein n=1 Tax=Streptomyces africanus TaxID=231024 RepID=A0ABU0QRM5_9ACTN|nr:hypothetical protein [Streptomyces africanus]MDQ0749052.1 hypothetical protein [Streptomyces africanus]